MIERKHYMDKLTAFKDQPIIKVVTGVRRCGKSTLLMMFRRHLLAAGAAEDQIVAINFEDIAAEPLLDYRQLHQYVLDRLVPGKMTYVFLDEVQNVPHFQKAVDSLFLRENIDIYLTGSNAFLLSGELATLLSGRYIEISMLPFSFAEFFSVKGGDKRDAFTEYFKTGGFPYLASVEDASLRFEYIAGIYNTVLVKDVVTRNKITDVTLLNSIIKFLFDNIGNVVSPKKIADTLTTNGRKTTSVTVERYIQALVESFILYKAERYDVKGKQYLKSLEKYYIVDSGLRQMLLGDRQENIGHLLENIVYLELLRRGYCVHIGKVGLKEIDFVAHQGNEKVYYQVAASVLDENTLNREIAPLESVGDHYPKVLLTMDDLSTIREGIRQVNIIDFLLGE